MNFKFLFIFPLILFSLNFLAQENKNAKDSLELKSDKPKSLPVSVESGLGSRGFFFQSVVNKPLRKIPKLGFFSVTNVQTDWGTSTVKDYMVQGKLTYNLAKGVNIGGGFFWNPIDGVLPSANLSYATGSPNYAFITAYRMDVHRNPTTDIITILEVKPKLNESLRLYTRLQGLYAHSWKTDAHARSYIMLRGGVTYREVTFGLMANLDWYGSQKMYQNNFGGFFSMDLF